VTAAGSITVANGDRATFGGTVRVSESGTASGIPTYADLGPAQ
jgi:hypothetical protein